MKFLSFNEWVKLNEGKSKMYTTSEPKQSDVEKLSRGRKIKLDTKDAKPRIPVGKPASACGMGDKKKKYNRSDFKRIED